VKAYSGGMRRRLDIAASIIVTAEPIFLDEPTTGLDPRLRNQVWDILRALAAGGTTILLSTQYLEEADRLADEVAVIDHGRVIAQGTPGQQKAGAIAGSTGDYLQLLLPGVLVMSLLFSTVYSGVALNSDATKGVVDRFRSLPIPRSSPLLGAVLGDSVRYLVGAGVIIGLGVALGYRPEAGLTGILAAVALVVAFAFGLSWGFAAVGLLIQAPNAVSSAGSMVLFPLVFLSNVFVEPETLPGWPEAFVDVSPISHLVTAARGLMDGTVAGLELTVSLGTAALLTAAFAPLTTYLYGPK